MRIRSLLAAALLGTTALATFGAASAPAQGDAKVRVAHFSPDAENVDIYIDGKKKMNGVPYLAMSEYVSLAPGKHTFDVRSAGTPATAPAALSTEQTIAAGTFSTIAAIGPLATIKAGFFNDKIATPAAGKAKVRVIHAADGTADVDVSLKTGAVAFPKVPFGTATEYSEVDAGAYDLQILGAGTQNVVLAKNVTLQAGGVYTISAVGGADKPPTLRGFVDLAPGASVTTVAAATPAPTTAPAATPTTVATAAPTTVAAASPTTVAASSPTTEVAETTAETAAETTVAETVAETEVAETATESTADTTLATPKNGVKTGFGGMSDSQSSVALIVLGLVAAGAVFAGRSRRRWNR